MDDDTKMLGLLLGFIALSLMAVGLVALVCYWIWMFTMSFIGALLGALVGAFVYGYHLFM
jgi:hypothetical protein